MSDKMKKEFEVWAMAKSLPLLKEDDDSFNNFKTIYAWQAWQASRQSLVVKLPELYETPSNGNVYFPEEITDALDAAGVKYE
jgi:hypothetical protein